MGLLRYNDVALSVGAVGTTLATSGSSQNAAIPNTANGVRARFVRIEAPAACYIKFTKGAGTATPNDIQVAANYPEIYDVMSFDTINYLQLTATTSLNVTPLET